MNFSKIFLTLAFLAFPSTFVFGFAFDGAKVANIEKHAGNYGNCATASSGDYAYFRFRLSTGVLTEYYVVSINSSAAYKDILSIALTAMTSGLSVNVRGDESKKDCGSGGTLSMINLTGN